MNKVMHLLIEAQKRMPVSIGPAVSGDMLLTLLFWKLLSDWWRVGALRFWLPYGGHDPAIIAMEQGNQLMVQDAAIYEACQWKNPLDAGGAIRSSLYALTHSQSNRALDGVLRPERFGPLGEFNDIFSNSAVLAQVTAIIGGISAFHTTPQVSMGHIFTRALDILQLYPAVPPINIIQLMVELLNPLPGDSIYDPVCGTGQCLMAAATWLGKHHPDHQLVLYGQENQSNLWALAKMQLLMRGLLCHRLDKRDALDAPMRQPHRSALLRFDVVLLVVPSHVPSWDVAGAQTEAESEAAGRFPIGVPDDGRLALVWHALASLKPETGRLCVWISLALLESDDALPLRHYLISQHLLEAVVQLPAKMRRTAEDPAVLLLVRQQACPTHVAFFLAYWRPSANIATGVSTMCAKSDLPMPPSRNTCRTRFYVYWIMKSCASTTTT